MSHFAYIRGRPNTPLYNSKMALYVCEHRYKPSTKSFKRIKIWAVCGPEETRKNDYPLKENAGGAVESLAKIPSPFVRGLQGPGGIGNAEEEEEEDQEGFYTEKEKGKANANAAAAALTNGGMMGGMGEMDFGMFDLQLQPNGAVGGQLTPADLAVLNEAFNPLPDGIGQSFSFQSSEARVLSGVIGSFAIPYGRGWRSTLVHRSAGRSYATQEARQAFNGLPLLESDGVAEKIDEEWYDGHRDGLVTAIRNHSFELYDFIPVYPNLIPNAIPARKVARDCTSAVRKSTSRPPTPSARLSLENPPRPTRESHVDSIELQ